MHLEEGNRRPSSRAARILVYSSVLTDLLRLICYWYRLEAGHVEERTWMYQFAIK